MSQEHPLAENISQQEIPSPERQKRLEMAKEFFHKENFQLSGKDFELYGVLHTPETIELHHQELEAAIEKAGVVVVELGPDIAALRSALKHADLTEQVKTEISAYFDFYEYISNLAARQNKLVINADPSEGGRGEEMFKDIFAANEKDEEIQSIKSLIAAGLPAALIAFALRNKLGGVMEKKISRRAFLDGVIGAAAIGSLASLSKAADYFNRQTDRSVGRVDNPFGQFLYNLEDYRDLVVPEALDELSKRETKGPIAVVYGDTHRSALKHYALSPKERKIKRQAYAPYDKVLSPKMRIYKSVSDPQTGQIDWTEIESKNI